MTETKKEIYNHHLHYSVYRFYDHVILINDYSTDDVLYLLCGKLFFRVNDEQSIIA